MLRGGFGQSSQQSSSDLLPASRVNQSSTHQDRPIDVLRVEGLCILPLTQPSKRPHYQGQNLVVCETVNIVHPYQGSSKLLRLNWPAEIDRRRMEVYSRWRRSGTAGRVSGMTMTLTAGASTVAGSQVGVQVAVRHADLRQPNQAQDERWGRDDGLVRRDVMYPVYRRPHTACRGCPKLPNWS